MIEKLACKLGRNDEVPNIELAEEIVLNEDTDAIKELAMALSGKDKAVANDAIKVLYEIGERKPELIAPYAGEFLKLLSSGNNRLVWGGMTALATITSFSAERIYEEIDIVLAAFHHGSVITVDNSITVLAGLCRAKKEYKEKLLPILMKHLKECRPKEVPQHAERIFICIEKEDAQVWNQMLEERKPDLSDAQNRRIKKLIVEF